ncbi:MAG: 50S ribosomal protein L4 [Acidobacteria bacterium]|nr:50S ribosomal protein L4 [Acidobacteriota bacterium]MCB9399621.1 50S ribosomal protein L4 [Acidobacteriota bacterium]
MATTTVYNLKNEKTGEIELLDSVFAAPVNKHLMWEAVNHYLAAGRAGTASTKTRGEVAGSGKKLWKQKGTGRARVGDIRTPKWRGGGTVHGPKPRSFNYAFPKQKRRGALRSALSAKFENGQLTVVEAFELSSHKTKDFANVLATLNQNDRTLVVDGHDNLNLVLASRNLPTVKFASPLGVNIHDLLKYENLIISKDAVQQLQEVLAK